MPYTSMLDGFRHVSASLISENLWSRFSKSDNNEEILTGNTFPTRIVIAQFGSCMFPVSYVSVGEKTFVCV